MKKILLFPILLLFSCSENKSGEQNAESIKAKPVYKYIQGSKWLFVKEGSDVNWSRILDQKATSKKIKMFGSVANVKLGPVKLNMEGKVQLKEGYILDRDGIPDKGEIIFDVATFSFAKEKGDGLFDVKKFPYCNLNFIEFKPKSDSSYATDLLLTIQEKSDTIKDVDFLIKENNKSLILTGQFKFNTLDFPLRENAKKQEVNKDEITVNLNLKFDFAEKNVVDSVLVNMTEK